MVFNTKLAINKGTPKISPIVFLMSQVGIWTSMEFRNIKVLPNKSTNPKTGLKVIKSFSILSGSVKTPMFANRLSWSIC